jgi:flavin reductase ActVB
MTTHADQDTVPVDSDTFRNAMSCLAAPLTVVTTCDDGARWGFTASSVSAASLEPPLVLVGIAHTSSCLGAVARAPEFVINVLDQQHHQVAQKFATRDVDRFAGQNFDIWPGTDLPYLTDAHAALRCVVADRIPVGDHDLLIGKLVDTIVNDSARPLLWYGRAFRTLASSR